MARFKFELEALLKLRKREEQDAQVSFAACRRKRDDADSAIAGTERRLDLEMDARRRAGGLDGMVEVDDVRAQAAAISALRAELVARTRARRAIDVDLEQRRVELAKRASARRAIELLREKRYDAWKAGIAEAEARELDDQIVMRSGGRSVA